VAAYRHRDRLIVANVGDSRAVLGCEAGSGRSASGPSAATGVSGGGAGCLRSVDLSSDQKPSREDERRRVLAEGGSVHQSAVPVRQGLGGPVRPVRIGPERVWDKTGQCGLCMTRSMGDLAMRPFITAQPEVAERQLGPRDKLLILGSDGVWDHVGSQEAVDIAAGHRDPTAAAREITRVARQRWHAETQGQLSDDITAVVMLLDHNNGTPPSSRGAATPPNAAPPGPSGLAGRGLGSLGPVRARRFTSQGVGDREALGARRRPGEEDARRTNSESAMRRVSRSQRLAALESLRPAGERGGGGLGSTAELRK
jgi:serine/threonine protein phosphatase PrpC